MPIEYLTGMTMPDSQKQDRRLLWPSDPGPLSAQELRDTLEGILKAAARDLAAREPDLYDLVLDVSGQTEWNLTAHYAPEVAKYFPGYSYDVDVLKSLSPKKARPDIIIHRRGTHEHNLLVIEAKRNQPRPVAIEEMEKITGKWFPHLGYRFGAVVNFKHSGPPEVDIEVNPAVNLPGVI